jgi:DNA (cytosine-5)-methyltransferase 1
MKEIRTIELFAGVGGFRLGLERSQNANYEIVWSNQWEPNTKEQHASNIYVRRFGASNHSNMDISAVPVEDIPDHDLLTGGFPCQDYSVANTLKNSRGLIGKKGVLWWEIYRILEQKGDRAPRYLMLENVDRLLKSPSNQKGRDFAIILSSLNSLGYAVEWRVIDASEYGMPQRRRRTFIMGYMQGTKPHWRLMNRTPFDIFDIDGLFAKAFPIRSVSADAGLRFELSDDLVYITQTFNKANPKNNLFLNAGYMVDGIYHTVKCVPDYTGERESLGNILQPEAEIPEEFYIDDRDLGKWRFQKGSKSIERIDKKTGHAYMYAEGGMAFPDSLEKPTRTIITGEGGPSPSRFKHVVCVSGRYRRLTPVELERANMFPDGHTAGVTASKRAFLMGNALVVGVIERLGSQLAREI